MCLCLLARAGVRTARAGPRGFRSALRRTRAGRCGAAGGLESTAARVIGEARRRVGEARVRSAQPAGTHDNVTTHGLSNVTEATLRGGRGGLHKACTRLAHAHTRIASDAPRREEARPHGAALRLPACSPCAPCARPNPMGSPLGVAWGVAWGSRAASRAGIGPARAPAAASPLEGSLSIARVVTVGVKLERQCAVRPPHLGGRRGRRQSHQPVMVGGRGRTPHRHRRRAVRAKLAAVSLQASRRFLWREAVALLCQTQSGRVVARLQAGASELQRPLSRHLVG